MDAEPINWLAKAADYAWALALVVGAAVGRAFVKLGRHDERLDGLDEANLTIFRMNNDLSRKIDYNHSLTLAGIESLHRELRADMRIILTKLMEKGPHG